MGLTLSEAVDKMRGEVGTEIDLLISREGADAPIEMTLVRDIIKIRSVRHRVEGNSGYIRITTFNQNAEGGVKKAIQEIKAELGNKLNGYVLDLRNNPGGLLDQAIAVSDVFLDKGEIVSTRGRHEDDTKRDIAGPQVQHPLVKLAQARHRLAVLTGRTPGDLAEDLPIVVLINGGSASASEIVAGALQDHRRAILLGTQSFGKGSVQTVIPLPGHGAMRLTTARYYTPSGRSIQAKGIEPDILVEPAKIETYNIKRLREENLKGALDRKAMKDDREDESEGEGEDEGEGNDEEVQDYQLMRALDLLNGLMLYKGEPRAVNDNAPAPAAESSAAETQSQP